MRPSKSTKTTIAACSLNPATPRPPLRNADAASVAAGMRLVRGVVWCERRRSGHQGDTDELVSRGYEGLVSAFASFDPMRGVPFPRWAEIRTRGAIRDGLRTEWRWRKRHRADVDLGHNLADVTTAGALPRLLREPGLVNDVTPEHELAHEQLAARARKAIRSLPAPEQGLVLRHYYDGVTLADAGAEMGLSRSWASRLHARALSRIRRTLASGNATHGGKRIESARARSVHS